MTQQDYIIAGHRIRVEGDRLVEAVAAMPGFETFKAPIGTGPLCHFTEKNPHDENTRRTEKETDVEKILYTVETTNNRFRFCKRSRGGYRFILSANNEILSVDMTQDGSHACFSGCFSEPMLRFACWAAYGLAVLPYKTVAIHASAIQYRNRSVLFLGESGTGKSTHTRLWCQHIFGAQLLNDDSPILRIVDGRPVVFGSPWSGKTACFKNEYFPLAACVRLSQAPYNKICRLRTVAGFAALHPSCPPAFAHDENLYDSVSDFLSDVLKAVPVFRLECLPDAAAAQLSRQTLFEP